MKNFIQRSCLFLVAGLGLICGSGVYAQDMTGDWALVFSMENLDDAGRVLHVLQHDGQLKGVMVDDSGETDITGSVDGNAFVFRFAPHPGASMELELNGTFMDGTLEGHGTSPMGDIAFTGERMEQGKAAKSDEKFSLIRWMHSKMAGAH